MKHHPDVASLRARVFNFPTPTPIAPEVVIAAEFRRRIEDEIESLLSLLDDLDGDCDLEDGADAEPSLGGTFGDDRELDQSDDEFTLGWTEKPDQTFLGFTTDLEDDNDTGFGDGHATISEDIPFFPDGNRMGDAEREKVREVFDAARRLAWTRMGRDPDTVTLLGSGLRFERRF